MRRELVGDAVERLRTPLPPTAGTLELPGPNGTRGGSFLAGSCQIVEGFRTRLLNGSGAHLYLVLDLLPLLDPMERAAVRSAE
jgi:hypothetical protein